MHKSITSFITGLLCLAAFAAECKSPGAAAPRRRSRIVVRHPHQHSVTGFIGLGAVNEIALSGGLEYQYFPTAERRFSFVLPVAAYAGGTITFGEFDGGETRSKVYGVYIVPGVRYHPFGNARRADLGLGAGLILGIDHRRDMHMSDYGYQITRAEGNHFLGGLQGQISADFHARNHPTVFGLFVSAGYLPAHSESYFPQMGATTGTYFLFGLRVSGQW